MTDYDDYFIAIDFQLDSIKMILEEVKNKMDREIKSVKKSMDKKMDKLVKDDIKRDKKCDAKMAKKKK